MKHPRIDTFEEAEAATEAARRCYEALVIRAAREAGGKSALSKLLGYDSPGTVHNAIVGGKFSAIRRIATACHAFQGLDRDSRAISRIRKL